jgi:hypothetical protein
MHDIMHQWARDWQFSPHSILDLLQRLGVGFEPRQFAECEGWSETAISNKVRLDAADAGQLLWRNNVGAWMDPDTKSFVRYGLCNDSKELNNKIKSSDLIGIDNSPITLAMVGLPRGQFVAKEVKEYGWKYTGTLREEAQLKFGQIVIARGGAFKFTTGEV